MRTKLLLMMLVSAALFVLVIGQVQAESIELNGDFKMYKPGTNYTVRAHTDNNEFWTQGIGDDLTVLNGVVVNYDDGTIGTVVDCPGWITPITLPEWRDIDDDGVDDDFTTDVVQLFELSEVLDGTSALNCFGQWSGQQGNLAESTTDLGLIGEGASYTLSGRYNGDARPETFELRAGGVAMTPSSSAGPVRNPNGDTDGWVDISRTYNAEDITAFIGQPITIRLGTTPPHIWSDPDVGPIYPDTLLGGRGKFDNITLEGDNLWNPYPKDGETIIVDANLELSWNNRPPAPDSNEVDVYVDVWFGTEPNELHPDYDMTLIVDAGENTTAVIVDASVEDTYYWQVNTYVYGADNINDANMIEGELWIFYAVEDLAPEVEIVTLDQMTWAGEGVPLDATVTDDGKSAVTIEWTADLPTGIAAAFDPGNDVEDTTVTLTKVPYSTALIVNAGFEDPVLADGDWDVPPGWDLVGSSSYSEIWTVNPSDGGGDYDCFGGIAPEGENIGISGTSESVGGLAQVLTETLTADTTYELTVEVGRNTLYEWVGYRVQLLAGGTVLAEDDDSMNISPDTFKTSTVTHISGGVSDPNIGLPLEIRLLALGADDYLEVNFDDVRLTADPPFPAPTGVSTVTLTLAVNDEFNPTPVEDSMTIDVYDTACLAARIGLDLAADHPADFDRNCKTDLEDLAVIAAAWLNDNGLAAPQPK